MKTPFKVFGYKISYNEKYKRLCIHIPLPYFNYETETIIEGINTKTMNTVFLIATYLYNEGLIALHEDYCIDFKDMFTASTVFKNHPIN